MGPMDGGERVRESGAIQRKSCGSAGRGIKRFLGEADGGSQSTATGVNSYGRVTVTGNVKNAGGENMQIYLTGSERS
uniref:Uncharacterized protein n=1 Tax=Romanomermis culicivorax TaxID=13658 RepID=A0A915IYF9_ROMCU